MARLLPDTLATRVGLLLTALCTLLFLALALLWLSTARAKAHEEVETASRITRQWLQGVLEALPPDTARGAPPALLTHLGRLRANTLEVFDPSGALLYRSPGPRYKAGREAPPWFSALLAPTGPDAEAHTFTWGTLRLVLTPDVSRSVLDAWDDLLALVLWGAFALCCLLGATRWALARTLGPLHEVMAGLDRLGRGDFSARLPVYSPRELGRLAQACNGLAARLEEAINAEVEREVEEELDVYGSALRQAERAAIARELHDELAQGITAVRALAGALARSADDPAQVAECARHIVTTTGTLHTGVRSILQRLTLAPSPVPPSIRS